MSVLDNNENQPSTVEPVATTDEPFYTSDGYQWLRLYRIENQSYLDFSTNNVMPITANSVNNRPDGAVYTIKIDSPGTEYLNRPNGTSFTLSRYYCRIVGDGRDGIAAVSVDGRGRIDQIRVVNPGYGYTHAKLQFENNKVYQTLSDLNRDVNGLLPGGNDDFRSTVIISPPGGWGYRRTLIGEDLETIYRNTTFALARQLGGTRVAVFMKLEDDELGFITETLYRQLGILQDPEGNQINVNDNKYILTKDPEDDQALLTSSSTDIAKANNRLLLDTSLDDGGPTADYRPFICKYNTVKVFRTSGGDVTKFYVGETIKQGKSLGQVCGVDVIDGTDDIFINYFQDPFLHCDPSDGSLHPFSGSDLISGDTSFVEGRPDVAYNQVYSGQEFVAGYSLPQITPFTGLLTHIDNKSYIVRTQGQREKISIVLEF